VTFRETFHLATRTLRRNTLRSALTLVGITIGVGAVVTMVAVGNGARASIEGQVVAAGMNVITVVAGNYQMKGEEVGGGVVEHNARLDDARETGARASFALFDPEKGGGPLFVSHPEDDPMEKHDHPTAQQRLGDSAAGLGAAATLTRDDAAAIRGVQGVQYVSAGVHESARVVVGDRRWFTRLHGAEPDLQRIRRSWHWNYGRFFSEKEFNSNGQVVVLGSVASEKLFGAGVNPVGREVRIWNQAFTVVGVLSSTNWATSGVVGDDQFDAVYVPLTTVHRLLNLTKLNSITVTSISAGATTKLSKTIVALLRKRHHIAESAADDFVVQTQSSVALGKGINPQIAKVISGNAPGLEQITLEQLSRTLERSSRTMTVLLASVAAVSLLVGGIGIMNIMLLSVTERTREIGLRMALGARSRDVMLQFLAEAVTLSLVGGFVGVLLGLAASGGVRQVLRWSTEISPSAILLAVAVAAAVGVFFGIYPARQAAQLDPIDALRYE
jgi:putative ABC transport system permease protein